jgi:hypothetical protein
LIWKFFIWDSHLITSIKLWARFRRSGMRIMPGMKLFHVLGDNPNTPYTITNFGFAIGIAACIATFKTHPEIAWLSIAVVLISWGSGPAQGIHRYVLGAPAVFVALARWGKNPVFDRAWTILSILLMGLLAMLYAFNMWVA